jgi:hypothetical protein
MTARIYLGFGLAGALTAASTGVAFAAWLNQGPELLVALVQSGLAWCF